MDVGAVTWGNGATGISGVVSSSNSLVGSTASDNVGNVTSLTNGNYIVSSPFWDGTAADVGAATWGNGATGITGAVSSSNSLVGSTASDQVGNGVTALTNGNYVVRNPVWDGAAGNVGAATWGNGATGITGAVSSSNSLVGSTASDSVGIVTALTNGNYVVTSSGWDGAAANVGAATWGNGATGITGAVSSLNSLVGSTANNNVGASGVTALTNGNYVVRSPFWDGTAADVGAATWGNGATGITGAVSSSNSLVGSTLNDNIGNNGVTALTNGNYVVRSSIWDGAAANVGAATWGNGASGITGAVSSSNSLVGSTLNDNVGGNGVTALTNGNYVVSSSSWDGAAINIGAVTWGNGATGITGAVSSSNSLVGSTANDSVGGGGVTALTNGNYVVSSSSWDGAAADVGAATWGDGATGISGAVSSANSLVGSTANDSVSNFGVAALTNGNYVVRSGSWDNGAIVNAGAVSYLNGFTGTNPLAKAGGKDDADEGSYGSNLAVMMSNSILGTTANGGSSQNFSFDAVNNQIAVGRPFDNIVTLFGALAPSAANVSISGRVSNDNRGIARAIVHLTDQDGNIRTARTNPFGYYRFTDVEVGQTLIVNVFHKQYQFDPQVVSVNDNIANLDFTAQNSSTNR